ncbi:uncharacterized protein LOC131953228 [Physella acuta]|uniref:uncharacterized protein LOC131953228 n=1 Tax=Physella acuta TaxID=109671 RepID=UPI0027DD7A5B|nr:uncharacterized protein LOC131953228 [Physella acuta]
MTKVKTILAEFCSPKDILAINRLGLIKNDERDTQPVPWRHRLPNSERRDLVRSEMTLRPTTKVHARDKARAVHTARNPKDSKMGECLLNNHVRGDPLLGSNLGQINRNQKRREQGLEQSMELFLRKSNCLSHEPLILVERAPSQSVQTRAALMREFHLDPEAILKPRYMRPLVSRSRTPSTLVTIEAFTVQRKLKKNIWDEAIDETPKFTSTSRPSARLTKEEFDQLQAGYSSHKPTAQQLKAGVTGAVDKPRSAGSRPRSVRPNSVFITQMTYRDSRSEVKS